MEMTKAKNLIVHHDEIHSRPARVWFQDKETGNRKRKSTTGIPLVVERGTSLSVTR